MKRLLILIALLLATPALAQNVPLTPSPPVIAAGAAPAPQFTPDELRAMLQFIDLGIKAGGLQTAEAGVVLSKKIQAALEASSKDQPK